MMGNRFQGGLEKGAMPWSHRYIGNPVLSFLGRIFFRSKIRDFHCGLRGYNRESMMQLDLKTTGMEYASEMIVMAELNDLRIAEIPTTLSKDGRSRPPHLNTISDGWRHLKFLFMYCPDWLFLYPGIVLSVIGLLGESILSLGQVRIGAVVFGIHTLLYCMLFLILGGNIVFLYVYTKIYASKIGLLPADKISEKLARFSVDKGIFIGVMLLILGIIMSVSAVAEWREVGYKDLIPEDMMRIAIPSITAVFIGAQFIFSSFFIGILTIKTKEGV